MATPILTKLVQGNVAWAASGNISKDLSPQPITITRMDVIMRTDVTTTGTPGSYSDPWDRTIATLALNGAAGQTYLNMTDLRLPYHHTRLVAPWTAPKRPDAPGASQTNRLKQIHYRFHFGFQPMLWDERWKQWVDNPFDLSAAIPPAAPGNLNLAGTFGAAASGGSGWTVNVTGDCILEVYLTGIQADAGDPPWLYQPRYVPAWTMVSPTLSGTSSAFQTSYQIPSGGFLHSATMMLLRGANNPRDDQVLNSIQLYDNRALRPVITYGGQAGSQKDYKAAEFLSQCRMGGWPPSDTNAAAGQITTAFVVGQIGVQDNSDMGLVHFPIHQVLSEQRRTSEAGADFQFNYGINNSTSATLEFFFRKYLANPLWTPPPPIVAPPPYPPLVSAQGGAVRMGA
jgi:hypothetical protein